MGQKVDIMTDYNTQWDKGLIVTILHSGAKNEYSEISEYNS